MLAFVLTPRWLRRVTLLSVAAILAVGTAGLVPVTAYVVHGVLRPWPFPGSGEIVRIRVAGRETRNSVMFDEQGIASLRESAGVLRQVGAYSALGEVWPRDFAAAEPMVVCYIDAEVFRVLAVPATLGRAFTADEAERSDLVAVVSHRLSRTAHFREESAIGKSIGLGSRAYRIVGVMPEGFRFPSPAADVWIPFPGAGRPSLSHLREAIARVPAGTNLRTGAGILTARLRQAHALEEDAHLELVPLSRDLSSTARQTAPLLVVGLLALLTVSAAGSYQLVRIELFRARQEIGVRLIVGGTVHRVLSRFLLPVLGASLIGCMTGAGVASLAVRMPQLYGVVGSSALAGWLDGSVLVGTAFIWLAVSVVVGVVPVVQIWRSDLRGLLDRGQTATAAGSARFRRAMLVTQAVSSTVFLITAILAQVSMGHLTAVSPGFKTDQLLSMRVTLARLLPQQNDETLRFNSGQASESFGDLEDALRRLPGVVDVAVASLPPVDSSYQRLGFRAAQAGKGCEWAESRIVSGSYFRTVGVPLEEGRLFRQEDANPDLPGVVVSRSLASACWPDRSPIGQAVDMPFKIRVVGIVGDVRLYGVRKPAVPALYLPASVRCPPSMSVLLRVRTDDPYAVVPSVRGIVASRGPDVWVSAVRTLDDIMASAEAPLSLRARLLGQLAASTVLAAAIGVYTSVSFSSRQRRRERAVRVALGATPTALVVGEAARAVGWSIPGVVVGSVLAYVGAQSMAPLLFGVSPLEWWIYLAAVTLVLLLVGLAAWLASLDALDDRLQRLLHAE